MKKFRRVLLLVVCLAVMMALSAVTASAAGSETKTDTSVAKVGDLYYDTLKEAIESIETEGTVEVIADTTVKGGAINIRAGQSVTLDLAEYKVTMSSSLYNSGTLTIKGDNGGSMDASNSPGLTPVTNRDNPDAQLNIQSGRL